MTAVLDDLPGALTDRDSGQIHVLAAATDIRPDSSGELALFLTLTLADPPAGAETWSTDDLWQLRRTVRSLVQEVDPDLDLPWFLQLEVAHPELADDDDSVAVD